MFTSALIFAMTVPVQKQPELSVLSTLSTQLGMH